MFTRKIVDIEQVLLDLFENVTETQYYETQCIAAHITEILLSVSCQSRSDTNNS